MNLFKNKLFVPFCLMGALIGYVAGIWVMPKIFNPAALSQSGKSTLYSADDILAAFGAGGDDYVKKTLSGQYLASRFAQRRNDWENASKYMDQVIKQEDDALYLKKNAMILNMGAGDAKQAIDLAQDIYRDSPDDLLTLLFLSLNEFKKNDVKAGLKILDQIPSESVAGFILPVLKIWTNAAQEKLDLKNIRNNPIYGYHALLAIDYLQRPAISRDFIENSLDNSMTDIRDLDKMADRLAYYGEEDRAYALYKKIQDLGFTTALIDQKIERIENKKPIDDLLNLTDIKSINEGIALVFEDMAEILYRESNDESALIFVQMGLYLNPKSESGRILLANIFARHERYDESIKEFLKISKDSKLYKTAQKQIASLYVEKDQAEKAIDVLEDLYAEEKDVELLIQIGDIYRGEEDYKNSVSFYNKAAKKWKGEIPESYWYLLYARGMSYERLKEYDKSEEDLEKALEYRPNHPYILNYLGYTLADQGRRLEDALVMIEKATKILPDDGHIADSLGWVLYRMGRIEEAIPYMEKAVELLPYDPIINDHLGDVYWHAGRRNEARFQWQRAVNYSTEKDSEIKEAALNKLEYGLREDGEYPKRALVTEKNTSEKVSTAH